jgi:GAF domain-containing protein
MSEESPLRQSMAALSRFFVGDSTIHQALQRVSELAVAGLPQAKFCGLTMMVDGKPSTAVFTDPDSPEIDQAQYSSGKGPCMDAFRTGQVQLLRSTQRPNQWPEFSGACVQHGILSTLSLPLAAGGVPLGAMNMYSQSEDAFDEDEVQTGTVFASQASIVLANAQAYWDAKSLSDQLNESMASRAVIEQAKGIIMSSMRCSAEVAFDALIKQSQHTNTKLRQVAQDIVDDISKRAT